MPVKSDYLGRKAKCKLPFARTANCCLDPHGKELEKQILYIEKMTKIISSHTGKTFNPSVWLYAGFHRMLNVFYAPPEHLFFECKQRLSIQISRPPKRQSWQCMNRTCMIGSSGPGVLEFHQCYFGIKPRLQHGNNGV